ncbi:MAG: aspartyl protease family protein [Planctomycetota bacterium]
MAVVVRLAVCALVVAMIAAAGRGVLAQVPIDGFFPLVGIGLTDEFNDDFSFFPEPSGPVSGNLLGPNGTAHYDLALLDTGAGFSLVTDQAFDDFNLDGPYPGEPDGYRGTESVTIGGATGQLLAPINDPFGLYASGLQDRSGAGATLTMDNSRLAGQTNTSTITLPPESDLPNILGLPFASQYATRISNESPQVFELQGKTIRTPAVEFLPLGSGGGDIVRKAPLNLNPGATFAQPPAYLPNIVNFDIDKPQENPSTPTLTQGGLFLNVRAENQGGDLGGTTEFFFDTGASVTVVSTLNALNLGFDVLIDEPEFTISVVGSGGILSDIPGFFVEEFTVVALGGSVTVNNVPVIVLDVADPSDPGNVVEGIVGTNIFSGRNVVIDPNPSLGGGGNSAGVYISDPVTNDFVWDTAAASADWSTANSWQANATPDLLSVARVAPTTGGDQEAVVSGDQEAWNVLVSGGDAGQEMTVQIEDGGKLTTFSGATIEQGAIVLLEGGTLDAQYVDIRGGTLAGTGSVRTGSGPIVGQVETIDGTIAPGDGIGVMEIDSRLSLGSEATLEFELGGTALSEYDQLIVSDSVALDGTLVVTLVDAFTPSVGDAFLLMTYDSGGGDFSDLDLPVGYDWAVTVESDTLLLEVLALSLFGDLNADGSVDLLDLDILGANFGKTSAAYDEGDLNEDGTVDLLDLDLLGSVFGTTVGNAIPEPTTTLLLMMAGLSAAFAGKHRATA